MILARTLKGKGLAAIEGKDGWHGKALKKGEETDDAIAELEKQFVPGAPKPGDPGAAVEAAARPRRPTTRSCRRPPTSWATWSRRAKPGASALAAVGAVDERIVALDADVKNSTFSDKFEKVHPDRFFENFIAEQVMVGAAMGLAARGAIPFPSTFACFLTRAADFIRMAGHLVRQRQARRLARRHLDRRGRAVADGARGSRR